MRRGKSKSSSKTNTTLYFLRLWIIKVNSYRSLVLRILTKYDCQSMQPYLALNLLPLNLLEAAYTFGLIVLSLVFRAVVGRYGSQGDWANSFLQTPVDLTFAGISFLLAISLKQSSVSADVSHLIPAEFCLLAFVYWLQGCAQKNLLSDKIWKMVSQLIAGLALSVPFLFYAIAKVTEAGPMQ